MLNKTLEAILLEGPAHKLPPGSTFDLENRPHHRALSAATLSICLIITTSMTFMRMYVKFFTVRKLHLEDCKFESTSGPQEIVKLTRYHRVTTSRVCGSTPGIVVFASTDHIQLFEVAHITPAWIIYTFDPVYHQWDMKMRDLIRLLLVRTSSTSTTSAH